MKLLLCLILLLTSATVVQAGESITVYLAGDSTMAQKLADKRPETGWGEKLQQLFNSDKVRVSNHAKNGRSTRTFLSENLWQQLVDNLKEGDYVFIEFGHNDQAKAKAERYTTPADFQANLVRFVKDVRDRKANPVLMTPVARRRFNETGNFYDTHGEYPELVRQVAAEYKVPLIDMHQKSERVLRKLGPEESRKLFLHLKANENPNYPNGIEDNTHFNGRGAEVMAELAAEGMRELKLDLARYLKPK
jgi:lysophospholipase L1-like esterase